ncbi:MAG: cytosolic protein [Nitriliruptorales bacterium]|nr:cytosolic protein [Nitriliruptorales bacterium]
MPRRNWPTGLVDTHVHTAPDVIPRRLNDLELARGADEAGYRALVLKSHHTITAPRATIAQEHTAETRIYGGVVLNLHATGGINPLAVETALRLGARVVWLPTFTSANQVRYARRAGVKSDNLKALGAIEGGGVEVLDSDGGLRPEVVETLDLLAAHGATLATGHVGAGEIMAVVPQAVARRVPNVIITHPEHSVVGLSVEQQLELAELPNVWFERVLVVTLATSEGYPLGGIAENIRTVGVDSTIMATDLGQAANPHPIPGLQTYIDGLLDRGFSHDDVERMACVNPSSALDLDGLPTPPMPTENR